MRRSSRKHLELAKREAAYLGHGAEPYDYFIDQNDPGMTAAVIGTLFAELKAELVPLVRAILESPVKARADALRGFSLEGQRQFLREVTERLGFDYQRGRIDVSLHPFCSGSGDDVRMTTRFKAEEPLDSLFSSIHETGHGLYEQGLPPEFAGTALGMHAGMGVHESQSRLWENQVARGRAFWRHFEPRLREIFTAQTAAVSSEELYLAVNSVAPTLIRVDSDEVTYNLHIILRFELEKTLFSGELSRCATCRRRGARPRRSCWASSRRMTARVCCRTCTGRAARSDIFRATASATWWPRSSGTRLRCAARPRG